MPGIPQGRDINEAGEKQPILASAVTDIPAIECPTLLIWGEEDAYLSAALADGNETFVPNLTVQRLPTVSHWVQQDAPDEINRLIVEWAATQGLT